MLVLALAAVAFAGPGLEASPANPAAPGRKTRTPTASVARPHVVWKPIPFGALRRAETAQYALRHYGRATWRLRPRAIVEHVTATSSFSSVWSAFAADVPDAELHERPGTCAHFVIDRDGTIYQLVPLDVVCRHTVGLNWAAIGIEHVGLSDAQVLADPAQMRASLELTLWLMAHYRIPLANVMGHAESLGSPLHRELDPAWRCQTHGDWQHADMVVYRSRLASLARRDGLRVGTTFRARPRGC